MANTGPISTMGLPKVVRRLTHEQCARSRTAHEASPTAADGVVLRGCDQGCLRRACLPRWNQLELARRTAGRRIEAQASVRGDPLGLAFKRTYTRG